MKVILIDFLLVFFVIFLEGFQPVSFRATVNSGREVGVNKEYSTFCINYLPEKMDNFPNVILDSRAHFFLDKKLASNIGIGFRIPDENPYRVYGINCFYDFRQGTYRNFHQFSGGLESLGSLIDFRLNFYCPVGQKSKHSSQYRSDKDRIRRYEYALRSAEFEIGIRLAKLGKINLYSAGGPYFIHRNGKFQSWGAKLRYLVTYEQFEINLQVSNDKLYKNRFQCGISYIFPFKFLKKNDVNYLRMSIITQPIQKNNLIILGNTWCTREE